MERRRGWCESKAAVSAVAGVVGVWLRRREEREGLCVAGTKLRLFRWMRARR